MKGALPGLLTALVLGAAVVAAGESPGEVASDATPAPSRYTSPAYEVAPSPERPPDLWDYEALIYVKLDLTAEGTIAAATIMDRGFGEKPFKNAVLASLKRARFRPGTMDGKAIPSTIVAPFSFTLGQSKEGKPQWMDGIRPAFDFELNKVEKLLAKQDYTGALQLAERIERNSVWYAYEYALLKAHLAEALAKNGRETDALRAAIGATLRTTTSFRRLTLHEPVPPNDPANYLLPATLITQLLEMRMQLSASSGLLLDALDAYYELAGLVKLTPTSPLTTAANRIIVRLEGNEPFTVMARIEDKAWSGRLFRRNFTLRQVKGTIDLVILECGITKKELRYAPAEEWSVPSDWNGCSVDIRGKAGTTFEFIELAN